MLNRPLGAMIETQIRRRGLKETRLLDALGAVDRAQFVPDAERASAYDDGPLPIGHGQTISQPYIVALMTAALDIQPGERVLEIGVGGGYQTAILLELGAEVFGVERIHELTSRAHQRLHALGYQRFHLVTADGSLGFPARADRRFDAALVAAAAPAVPATILDQLAPGGRVVIPVGDRSVQSLELVTLERDGRPRTQTIEMVRFVPLVGKRGFPR